MRSNKQKYSVIYVDELPSKFSEGVIYIEKTPLCCHTISFKCPCGCADVIYLNLLTDASPRWSFRKKWFGKISVFPSILRLYGCKSHFLIRRNRIKWMPDNF